MRFLARAIVGVVMLAATSGDAARAQLPKFAGWWPFQEKDIKEEKFALPSSTVTSAATQEKGNATPPAWVPPVGSQQSTIDKQLGDTVAPPAQARAPLPNSTTAPSSAPPTSELAPRTSFFPTVTWPEFQMPQLPKLQLPFWAREETVDQTRNAWVEKSPNPSTPSPWQAMTDGAQRVSTSTKAAWRKTVDIFTPGDNSAPAPSRRLARREEPSIWGRIFAGEPEPEGPQTVTEWMGQERIKP
jgi:hypothetical protein